MIVFFFFMVYLQEQISIILYNTSLTCATKYQVVILQMHPKFILYLLVSLFARIICNLSKKKFVKSSEETNFHTIQYIATFLSIFRRISGKFECSLWSLLLGLHWSGEWFVVLQLLVILLSSAEGLLKKFLFFIQSQVILYSVYGLLQVTVLLSHFCDDSYLVILMN